MFHTIKRGAVDLAELVLIEAAMLLVVFVVALAVGVL
jgi:hypothetical protein